MLQEVRVDVEPRWLAYWKQEYLRTRDGDTLVSKNFIPICITKLMLLFFYLLAKKSNDITQSNDFVDTLNLKKV